MYTGVVVTCVICSLKLLLAYKLLQAWVTQIFWTNSRNNIRQSLVVLRSYTDREVVNWTDLDLCIQISAPTMLVGRFDVLEGTDSIYNKTSVYDSAHATSSVYILDYFWSSCVCVIFPSSGRFLFNFTILIVCSRVNDTLKVVDTCVTL